MKLLSSLLASFLTITTFANNTIQFIDKYRAERGFFKTLSVPMHFDTDSITRVLPKNFKMGDVFRIDYIATSYTTALTDYQRYLNRKRWHTLSHFLALDEHEDFEKHAYYQTKFEGEEEAQKLFHGFILYYRQPASLVHEKSSKSSATLMETICQKKLTDLASPLYLQRAVRVDSIFKGNISKKQKKDIERQLLKSGNYVIEWGYDSLSADKKYYNSYYILTKVAPGIALAFKQLADRSLFDFFKRSKLNEQSMIVTDMTGSMYPYYSQLLVWHAFKMSEGKKMNHVFFNDGDRKPTSEKVIGNTGGIYFNRANDLREVYSTMQRCMKRGFGGDCPENNFEAVQKGLKRYPKTGNILLLCDNWAVPRDTALLGTINKPITYFMCGAEMGVNAKYVDLAAQNEGTIITLENSISNLNEAQKGEVVKIGKNHYKKGKMNFQKLY